MIPRSHPAAPPRQPGNRRPLVLLLLLFTLPFSLAAALHLLGWRPAGSASHGEVLQPPLELPPNGLRLPDGRPLPTADLAGRWQLVLAGNGPCATACQESLAAMAQVQRLLPKEGGRIGRLWLAPAPVLGEILGEHPIPGLTAATMDREWAVLLSPPMVGYQFYLADPAGRLLMRYGPETDPAGVRQDLERLLKYSWAT